MILEDDINRKALWEIVFYYLMETRDTTGTKVKVKYESEIRRLIISDSRSWFLIDPQDMEKICEGYIENLFYKFQNNQLTYSEVDKFYGAIKDYFIKIGITEKLRYVYFRIDELYTKKGKWQYLYKVFKKDYLLKDGYKQISKTHVLNSNFYQELLYLMGFVEAKVNKKNIIKIDKDIKNSLSNQIYNILINEKELEEEKAIEITFELVLVWINRLLFIKLFEGQLLSFNDDSVEYHIMDREKIKSFEDVQSLFFDILGKKKREDSAFLNKFEKIPYLNSSLFERYDAEVKYVNIKEIKNLPVKKKSKSCIPGKNINEIPLLEYMIQFFDAYTFTAQIDNKSDAIIKSYDIIDASVLGLIFEKINGYKEGSFYTKGFVTEYICQETIEEIVVDKLNAAFGWKCKSIDDLKMSIDYNSFNQIIKINEIINSIKICDPAAGSGHFLVSALNRMITIKRELGVLLKADGKSPFREYEIAVIDDILCVFDGQGREFKYVPTDYLSQQIQKTLFVEKRRIIENCLFGVDINPNAVAICQLRLWIELLKNAYYENGVMETLPNIDINIKCGNSLIHRLPFDVGQKAGDGTVLDKKDLENIKKYKTAVKKYHSVSDKTEKKELRIFIENIKQNLHSIYYQMELLFDAKGNVEYGYSVDYPLNRYQNAFEWAIEFPETLSENGVFVGFDCIIGNPPYIRVQEMKHEDIDYYKRNYETAWQRNDISTMFIELAYKLINKKGKIAFITSNQFLTTEYGRQMRHFLLQKDILKKVVDFGDLSVFDGALTYVSIFHMVKGEQIKELDYYKVLKLPFIRPEAEEFIQIPYSELSDEGWVLQSNDVKKCLNKIIQSSETRLSDYAKCWAGAFTGKDDLLMFGIDEKTPLEDEMLIPVIRADSCERYAYAEPSKKIYYPYYEKNEETMLMDLNKIEENYPMTYVYITQHEIELKGRKDSRKTFADKIGWYGLVRFGKLSRFKKIKIVSPGEVNHNKFSLDKSGAAFSCGRVFSITAETEDVDIRYLLALLNSKICEFYLHNTAAVKAGGYYSYSSKAIDSFPFILDRESSQKLACLVDEVLDKKEKQMDTSSLEKEIDDIVYEMYGFTEQEKVVVDKFLGY